jgi:hypothetical protein
MSGESIVLMVFAMVIVWGGLLASALFLWRRPAVESYPVPGPDDAAFQEAASSGSEATTD